MIVRIGKKVNAKSRIGFLVSLVSCIERKVIEMNKLKILAMYLPQYHEIKQNNEWWGKGFTEWTNVRTAKSLFKNHRQPRVPLNNNYYDLLDKESLMWQAELAGKYGIYGFCIYHYWFEGIQMMEKPLEIILENKDININFCFSWANHTWTKAPGKKKEKILISQTYGNEDDWNNHYAYLKRFFEDDRYIKIDNKPVLIIYDAISISCWKEMRELWIQKSKEDGWDGIYFISTLKTERDLHASVDGKYDAQFEYQPTFGVRRINKLDYGFWYHLKYDVLNLRIHNRITKFSYDRVWKSVISRSGSYNIKTFLGAFNDWDTSTRWGHKGNVMPEASPDKFRIYFNEQIRRSIKMGNEFLFFTAWNEWSEGAYLEPDTDYKYTYLEVIKDVLNENNAS